MSQNAQACWVFPDHLPEWPVFVKGKVNCPPPGGLRSGFVFFNHLPSWDEDEFGEGSGTTLILKAIGLPFDVNRVGVVEQ